MATSTIENYVKAIYLLEQDSPSNEATVVRLAAMLGLTKGSVTAMVRKLVDAKLANAERYGGITLTPKGRTLALDMLRRHRLIEVFLVQSLGFDWAEVHEEAERLEHAMSAKFMDRLDAYLGHPATDPHGDPIPDAQGKIAQPDHVALSELAKGDKGVIARISDQEPKFLDFAARHGLRPGMRFEVKAIIPEAESLTVQPHKSQPISLAFQAARKILVSV